MFGREARKAARERVAQEARQQAEADALFAEADRWADQAGEPAGFRREITRERAARVMEQLAEPLTRDARAAAAAEPELAGADLDAEVDRLAELYPEPEVPGEEPGPDTAPSARQAAEAGAPAADPVPVGEAIRDWMADLPEEGREFLREALGDAIEYRRAEAGDCADCAAEYGGLCYDHAGDEMAADRYADRLAQLNAEDELAEATARLYETPYPPAGLPRLLDPAGAAPRAPEATGLPDGTPHPDPVLAARGWQTTLGGMYHRVPQPEMELEAG
jgi:hypothetical protein